MQADSHKVPFFNKTLNLKVGLNQLGLRNAAEALFTSLLPGLNNVSERIRYYSFYCWIIGEFYKRDEGFTDKEFYRFIRYAEYLLALIHSGTDGIDGIPGITYALNVRPKSHEFNLQSGTYNSQGNTKSDTYWANAGGIFKQYYASSLKDIALLKENTGRSSVMNISKEKGLVNGHMLAEAFARNVGKDGQKFMEIIRRGTVTSDELDSLEPSFNMRKFPTQSDERDLMIEMLLQKDYPATESESCYRKSTICHFLRHFSRHGTKDDFTRYMYDEFISGHYDDNCILGWYRYHVNDNWQYQCSVILVAFLNQLAGNPDWQEASVAAEELASSILTDLGSEYGKSTLGEVCSSIGHDRIVTPAQHGNLDTAAAPAVVNLLGMYNSNKDLRDIRPDYREAFPRAMNHDFFTFMDEIDNCLETGFQEWLKDFILTGIIHCHYKVALRKYLQTGIASQKFIYENGMIRFLNGSEATHTAPRTDTLFEFLSDLELIDGKGITENGDKVLKRHKEEEMCRH